MYEKNNTRVDRIMEVYNNTYKRFNFHNSIFILDSSALFETEFITYLASIKTFFNEHNVKFKVLNSVVESVKLNFNEDQDDIFNKIIEVQLEAFTFLESLKLIEYIQDDPQKSVEENYIDILNEYSNKDNVYFLCNNMDFIDKLYTDNSLKHISEKIKIRSVGKYGFICNLYEFNKNKDNFKFHLDQEVLEHYFHNFHFIFREIFITAYIVSDEDFVKFMNNFLPFFDLYDVKFSILDFSINKLKEISELNNEYKERAEYAIAILDRLKKENRLVIYESEDPHDLQSTFRLLDNKLNKDDSVVVLSNYYKLFDRVKEVNEFMGYDKFRKIDVCTVNHDGLLIDFETLLNYPHEFIQKENCLPVELRLNCGGDRNAEKDILFTYYDYNFIHKQLLIDYSCLMHEEGEKFLHNIYLFAKYYKVSVHFIDSNMGYFYEAIDENSPKYNKALESIKTKFLEMIDEGIFIIHSVPPKNNDYARVRKKEINDELEKQFMIDANNVYFKSTKKKYSVMYITSDKDLKENAFSLNETFNNSSIETCEIIKDGFLGNFEKYEKETPKNNMDINFLDF